MKTNQPQRELRRSSGWVSGLTAVLCIIIVLLAIYEISRTGTNLSHLAQLLVGWVALTCILVTSRYFKRISLSAGIATVCLLATIGASLTLQFGSIWINLIAGLAGLEISLLILTTVPERKLLD
ncbi:MAG: hypothetical protein JST30_10160 [Armatimonadetes bacterium]|nr:hypothetical protein [Armatimonadota bacterium]